jgi:hypothetical protein
VIGCDVTVLVSCKPLLTEGGARVVTDVVTCISIPGLTYEHNVFIVFIILMSDIATGDGRAT